MTLQLTSVCRECGGECGPRQHVCGACQRRRYEQRRAAARKPCSGCGGVKEWGHTFLCQACRENTRPAARNIVPCPHADELPGKRQVCDACQAERRAARFHAFLGLPALPLVAAIDRLARREEVRNPFAVDEGRREGHLGVVCERAQIYVRHLNGMRRGERPIRLEDAEDVLTRLGLFWWEVWTEETVRLPVFVVTVYASQVKSVHGGEAKRRRVKTLTIPYGDVGPDHKALERIEALMTGEAVLTV